MTMKSTTVAIVGAGPYGLSLAAHLGRRGVPFRIFGPPMQVWGAQMPEGMHLKSDGFASDLYDPDRTFTLKRYCADRGIEYSDIGIPVKLDTFLAYALEFQRRFVPMLESRPVVDVRAADGGFQLRLDDGEMLHAAAVVMATGISYFGYVPAPLDALPPEFITHSSAHRDLSGFRGRRVMVIGGGASATDLAALLHRAGASVSLVSRRPLKFHARPGNKPPSLLWRLRHPNLGLGPGLRSAVYTVLPGLFHRLPRHVREGIVRRHLGPSGGWFIRDEVMNNVELHVGYTVQSATAAGGGVQLVLAPPTGKTISIAADHVIAATGYQVSVARLNLLDAQLRGALELEGSSPALSGSFESSVPGLYFIGVAAANNFGPLMRFARGAEFAAERVGARLQSVLHTQKTGGSSRTATA